MAFNNSYKLNMKPITRVQPDVMPAPGETGVYTNKIHYLKKYLLDELVTKKFAMDFMEPVDTAVLQVPNYYTVIKRPMDVGTIIKRVQNRYYHCVSQMIRDFRLVISNCFTFNRPGDVVYRNCQKLDKFFERVLNKMPKGEEKPSTKDPQAPGKQQSLEKAMEIVQRQCREQLKMLQTSIAKEDDNSICKYFTAKCDLLSQRVERQYFKTIEEFRFEVNDIFQNFDSQVRLFYQAHHMACDLETPQPYDNCHKTTELEFNQPTKQAEASVVIDKQDIGELLFALKRAESGVELCQAGYTKEKEERAKELIDAFGYLANKLKQKLRNENQNEENTDYGLMKPFIEMEKPQSDSSEEEVAELQESAANCIPQPNSRRYELVQPQRYKSLQLDNTQNKQQNLPVWNIEQSASNKQPQPIHRPPAEPKNAVQANSTLWSDLHLTSSSEDSEVDVSA